MKAYVVLPYSLLCTPTHHPQQDPRLGRLPCGTPRLIALAQAQWPNHWCYDHRQSQPSRGQRRQACRPYGTFHLLHFQSSRPPLTAHCRVRCSRVHGRSTLLNSPMPTPMITSFKSTTNSSRRSRSTLTLLPESSLPVTLALRVLAWLNASMMP